MQISEYSKDYMIEELGKYKDSICKKLQRDIENGIIVMSSLTYRELIKIAPKYCMFIHYDPITNDYGSIWGLKIKIDDYLPPFRFNIIDREEDNMAKNDDSLDAFTYSVKCYGGLSYGKSNKVLTPLPTKYIINDGATILFWSDGTKTIVKRAEDDAHDIAKSFLWAYFQKHSGLSKTKANKYLAKVVEDNIKTINDFETVFTDIVGNYLKTTKKKLQRKED